MERRLHPLLHGASFGSARLAPIPVRTRSNASALMYMRGRAIFDAVVTELMRGHGMGAASDVILSGGEARAAWRSCTTSTTSPRF